MNSNRYNGEETKYKSFAAKDTDKESYVNMLQIGLDTVNRDISYLILYFCLNFT